MTREEALKHHTEFHFYATLFAENVLGMAIREINRWRNYSTETVINYAEKCISFEMMLLELKLLKYWPLDVPTMFKIFGWPKFAEGLEFSKWAEWPKFSEWLEWRGRGYSNCPGCPHCLNGGVINVKKET